MQSGTTTSPYASSSTSQSGTIAGSTQQQSTNNFTTTTQTDAQVTTVIQQLDAQGPAVVERISTQVGDLACSQDTLRNLVDALHSGRSVTINSNVNGQNKSATFNASGAHLGYGEAYIALALAAEQLRNAGVTGCATPEQWQAVLLGGPLVMSNSSTSTNSFASASGSTRVPGIVTLHRQGQGWGQIAQSANVQLGQVVSGASVSSNSSNTSASLNTNNNTNANSTLNSSSSTSPSPTGYSSAEMNQGRSTATDSTATAAHDDNGKHKGEKKHHWFGSRDDAKDKDNDKSSSSANKDQSAAPDSTSSNQ